MTSGGLRIAGWPHALTYASTVPVDATPTAQRAAGQRAALDALARAGCGVDTLPPRVSALPRWPHGFVGSIAHDAALAVAVAARRDVVHTVGIDVERHDALDTDDASLVLTADERAFAGTDNAIATLLWCAKESAYKAWCTALAVVLDAVDPRDIHVAVGAGSGLRIEAHGALATRVASIGALQGASGRVDDLLVTLAWKLAPAAP